ncbi:chemotaxis protein CheW [Halodesulfovibrio marinisediminis]|uniref:CheW-like domain-containing protein n=1 Tax=Halodesulfovibrio marinisediminis DSM 17456 TaxID=1121457 RepID=A0A1N6F4V5_9BACT|nr:chemotaxis protein CheW [Halodesulfovibrio marinisediminis]SIN90246.1 CheW-like domain-containing protein [Halodesulfovibrio marinisediminis DSM 17456]
MLTQTSPQALKKIFTFSAGSETFGLPLHLLHEVIYPEHITRVPKAPAFMAGILTYGSETISVLDLSKKLCLAAPSIRVHHPAIIINTSIEDETMQLALLVERFGKIVQYKPSETIKRKNIPFKSSSAKLSHQGQNSAAYVQSREAIRKFVSEELYRAGVRIRLLNETTLFSKEELT